VLQLFDLQNLFFVYLLEALVSIFLGSELLLK